MKSHIEKGFHDCQQPLLLALHSSSDTLGVAVLDSRDPQATRLSATFPLGRGLANSLISCVKELLPLESWRQLGRLAVAIGPGGFTGTRLTLVMARTLAQQLNCPLHGVSSFALMAPRLASSLPPGQHKEPFWVLKHLPRRGTVAGRYKLLEELSIDSCVGVHEIEAPHLLDHSCEVAPALLAKEDVASDVERLLLICAEAHRLGKKSSWREVLPIYPTSPVGDS